VTKKESCSCLLSNTKSRSEGQQGTADPIEALKNDFEATFSHDCFDDVCFVDAWHSAERRIIYCCGWPQRDMVKRMSCFGTRYLCAYSCGLEDSRHSQRSHIFRSAFSIRRGRKSVMRKDLSRRSNRSTSDSYTGSCKEVLESDCSLLKCRH